MIVRLSRPYEIGSGIHSLGASIGIAFLDQDMQSPQDLVRKADSAMYRAKQDGKGHFVFAD